MSIEKKAARGVVWNMATGVGMRVVGLIGTLLLTRFIAPSEYGEVSAASIVVMTANQLTFVAVGQYIIANKSKPDETFQAGVLHLILGIIGASIAYLLREPLGVMLDAPDMGRLIFGFAISMVLDRIKNIPERLLVRELRFRTVALINSAGEFTFTVTALTLAAVFHIGGYAIMAAALARSVVTLVLFVATAPRSEWLVRTPIRGEVVRKIFAYGAPMLLAGIAERAASSWDNLIMLRMFGTTFMGCYALAYSLAETPLVAVADRIADVLMPAFSKMEPADRPSAVVRSGGLMALVVAPLGVGLGAVGPTVVRAFFDARWHAMSPILMILAAMTVSQPISWPVIAYLQTEQKTRLIMVTSFARAALLLGLFAFFGYVLGGPVWATFGLGLGFAAYSALVIFSASWVTPMSAAAYFRSAAGPTLSCIPMFFGVLGLRRVLTGGLPVALALVVEIVAGGVLYVGSALILARGNVRELLGFVRSRRSGKGTDGGGDDDEEKDSPASL